MTVPRTLIIDDNPQDRILALRELKKLFPQLQYWEISDETGFVGALEEDKFNLVITDYQLRWTTGVDILNRVRQHRPDCPVIMFTGTGSEEIAVSAMKAGLDDYVIKSPRHYIRLAAAVRSAWERSQQKKALDEFKQSYYRFFERVPLGLYRLDSEGKILEANSTLANILGFSSPEELRDKSFFNYHLEADSFLKWQKQLTHGASAEFESQIYRRDRVLIWIRHNATAVKDDRGNLVGYEGAVADITPSKQAELERIKLLEREREAKEQAETINRVKDEFLATLSHELRTPLNAIVGWVQLLQLGKMDESKLKKAIEVIDRNAKAQNQLIDDLLDVSRIIRGSMKLELKPADLNEIVMGCVDTVSPTAEAKNITINTQIDSRKIGVKADRERLQQVFWNLLINAVKFTPANGKITISSQLKQDTVSVKIEDTGQGIAEDVLPYIFDRFRQAEMKSSTRTKGGLGLGLAIVRHLIELHGGKVTAQSEGVGKGATFTVELPLFQKPIVESSSSSSPNTTSLHGLKLLIVEDDADACEVLTLILEQYGIEAIVVDSAQQALEQYRKQLPHILISDISMPGEDGYSLIRKIREEPNYLPAIALTANVREEDRQKALFNGFDLHLSKPIDPSALLKALEIAIERYNITYVDKISEPI